MRLGFRLICLAKCERTLHCPDTRPSLVSCLGLSSAFTACSMLLFCFLIWEHWQSVGCSSARQRSSSPKAPGCPTSPKRECVTLHLLSELSAHALGSFSLAALSPPGLGIHMIPRLEQDRRLH